MDWTIVLERHCYACFDKDGKIHRREFHPFKPEIAPKCDDHGLMKLLVNDPSTGGKAKGRR